ncbi:MAG: FtsL-like putative cell division protein [Flavobacteriales bacterium]|nr:FtsL-like putative cell division protein [Flavobacteriales bacterium]
MSIADSLTKFLRGEYFNKNMWKYTILAVAIAFTMVYSSASMDQKVYRLRRLKAEKEALATHYVEIQSELSQVRMKGGELEKFQQEGFSISTEPVNMIKVEK